MNEQALLDLREQIEKYISEDHNYSYFSKVLALYSIDTSLKANIMNFICEHKENEKLKYYLSNLIRKHGYTQEKISKITFIDKGNLSKIINGKLEMSKDNCVKIILALGLTKIEYEQLFKLSRISFYKGYERDLLLMFILENQSVFVNNTEDGVCKIKIDIINEVLALYEKRPLFENIC